MTWNEKYFHSKIVVLEGVLRNLRLINSRLVLSYCVYFYSMLHVVCDCDDLHVVALDVDLFYLTRTESCNIHSYKVFIKDGVLLQICSSHKSHIHDYIVSCLVIAKGAK